MLYNIYLKTKEGDRAQVKLPFPPPIGYVIRIHQTEPPWISNYEVTGGTIATTKSSEPSDINFYVDCIKLPS